MENDIEKSTVDHNKTQKLLLSHYKAYPELNIEDVFKFLFQSAFGCEHLVSSREAALDYIKHEYQTVPKDAPPLIEPLDGEYVRVHLSCINCGLTAEELSDMFCLSAKKEENGKRKLEEKLEIARELISRAELPLNIEAFDKKLEEWKKAGYPPIHHSQAFHSAYHPIYRVIANRYIDLIK